jgi:ribonuclease D
MRTRVQSKKQRQVMDVNSHKKHEVALAELAKRRSQQAERMKTKRRQVTEGKGASGARKYKHKHVEDFQQMKKDHRVRKDNRRLAASERTQNTRNGGGGSTIGSNTMPDIRRNRQPASRQPATRTAGTVTRRRPAGRAQGVPVRRGRNAGRSEEDDHVMPPIVGAGVGGARKIRQQRQKGGGMR